MASCSRVCAVMRYSGDSPGCRKCDDVPRGRVVEMRDGPLMCTSWAVKTYSSVLNSDQHSLICSTRLTLLKRAVVKAVLSVRLSVTLVRHAYAVQDIKIHFAPYDRRCFLFLDTKFHLEFMGSPRMNLLKRGTPVERKNLTCNQQ